MADAQTSIMELILRSAFIHTKYFHKYIHIQVFSSTCSHPQHRVLFFYFSLKVFKQREKGQLLTNSLVFHTITSLQTLHLSQKEEGMI